MRRYQNGDFARGPGAQHVLLDDAGVEVARHEQQGDRVGQRPGVRRAAPRLGEPPGLGAECRLRRQHPDGAPGFFERRVEEPCKQAQIRRQAEVLDEARQHALGAGHRRADHPAALELQVLGLARRARRVGHGFEPRAELKRQRRVRTLGKRILSWRAAQRPTADATIRVSLHPHLNPLAPRDLCKSRPSLRMTGRTPSAPRFNEGWIPAFAGMTKDLRKDFTKGEEVAAHDLRPILALWAPRALGRRGGICDASGSDAPSE